MTGFSSGSDDQALDGVLLPDGKLVVSGMSNATPRAGEFGPWDFAVARYVAIRFCVVPNVRRQKLAAASEAFVTRVRGIDPYFLLAPPSPERRVVSAPRR